MRRQGSPRPWRVFVFDIGPSFSYATEERAHERARHLMETEHYGKVSVYNAHAREFVRTLYRDGQPPVRQRLNDECTAWEEVK